MAPLEPQEKGFALADWHLKSCAACGGIRCLLGVVSKRLGLLLSSLSLCLRFGSLTQFPPTLDLYRFAIACRGGFAGARRSTHYQDDMHCQMIRLHQNKMSRAAADDRSRPNRIAMLTRLRRAQGSAIGKHRTSSSCSLAMEIFSGRVKGRDISFRKRDIPPLSVPLPAGKQHASPAGGNYCFFLIRINGVHWSS